MKERARLGDQALETLPHDVQRPSYDRADCAVGIVHIGVGHFHRCLHSTDPPECGENSCCINLSSREFSGHPVTLAGGSPSPSFSARCCSA
jgi:hypothetical protein